MLACASASASMYSRLLTSGRITSRRSAGRPMRRPLCGPPTSHTSTICAGTPSLALFLQASLLGVVVDALAEGLEAPRARHDRPCLRDCAQSGDKTTVGLVIAQVQVGCDQQHPTASAAGAVGHLRLGGGQVGLFDLLLEGSGIPHDYIGRGVRLERAHGNA